jgi:hypothetical protein
MFIINIWLSIENGKWKIEKRRKRNRETGRKGEE